MDSGRKRRFPVKYKKCAQKSCRKKFKAYAPSSKYCSPACRKKDYNIKTGANKKTIYQRFCKNPDCRKLFKTSESKKKYCGSDCIENYIKYDNLDKKYSAHIEEYVNRYGINYMDLPYCYLCGKRGACIPQHMVIAHPEIDLDEFYYKRDIKLSDMFHEEYYAKKLSSFSESKDKFIKQLIEYQQQLVGEDDDVI